MEKEIFFKFTLLLLFLEAVFGIRTGPVPPYVDLACPASAYVVTNCG